MAKITFSIDLKIESVKPIIKYEIIETPVSSGGTTTPQTPIDDIEYDLVADASVQHNALVTATNIPLGDAELWLHTEPNVAAYIDERTIVHTDYGNPFIKVGARGYAAAGFIRNLVDIADNYNEVTGFVAGSLAKHVYDGMIALINGLTPTKSILSRVTASNQDFDNPDVTINTSNFAAAYDFSGVSVMVEGRSGTQFPVTLVTNHHGIVAKHVNTPVGARVVFKRNNGTYQTVTITSKELVRDDLGTDLEVVYFATEITGVKLYKVPQADWLQKYVPSVHNSKALVMNIPFPTLRVSMHFPDASGGSCVVVSMMSADIDTLDPKLNSTLQNTRVGAETFSPIEIPFTWGIIGLPGDSGSPSFVLINGELIFITTQAGPAVSENLCFHTADIEAVMDSLASAAAGTFTLTHPDLSGFTDYL